MKSRIAKISLTTVSILLMLALVLSTVRPLVSAVQNRLLAFKEQVLELVEEKTALRITYDSISPNLLGGLKLKGVTIGDSLSGNQILTVKQIMISWALGSMDFGDINDILSHIKGVTIDDFTVDWDNQAQADLIQKLLSVSSSREGEKEQSSGFSFSLPFGVTLRSFTLRYRQNGFSAEIILPQVKAVPRKDGSTAITLSGTAGVFSDSPIIDDIDSLTVRLKARATLTQVLKGSLANLEVTSGQGDRIRLGTTSVTAKLTDDTVEATLVSGKMPYSLAAVYHRSTNEVEATFTADGFKPLSLVSVTTDNEWISKLHDLSVSGTYRVTGNLSDLGSSGICRIAGSIFIPPAVYAGGIALQAEGTVTAESAVIQVLSVVSPDFDVSYTGTVSFANLLPEGELAVNRFRLPSGNDLETLFYIDRLSEGFVMFAPQVYAGDMALTAVQAECVLHEGSVDFTLEASDYSHYETEVPGVISISGFASWDSGIDLQAQVSLDSLFAETIVQLADCVLPPESSLGENVRSLTAPYILSLDAYATTDFKSLVYNVPYAVIADTTRSDRMLLFSLGGNETTVSVTQFNLLYAGQEIAATISADADSSYDQVFFSTSLTLNEVPYSFSGAFLDRKYVTLQGDYGFDGAVSMEKNGIFGSFLFDSLPVALDTYMIQASVDASFEYHSLSDFSVAFNRLAVVENSGTIRIMPSLELSGSVNQWGMSINQLTFADTVNVLTGNGYVSWTLESDEDSGTTILSGGAVGLDVAGQSGTDAVSLSAVFGNPLKAVFSSKMLLSDSYLSAQVELDHVAAAHFLEGQASDDTITGSFTLQGALENPSIYVTIPAAHAKIGGSQVSASFEASLEDRIASIYNGSFAYSVFTLDQTDVSFDLTSLQGLVSATAGMTGFIEATAPISLEFSLEHDNQSAQLMIERLESNVADAIELYPIRFNRGGGVTALTAGWHDQVQAVFLESGQFFASSTGEFPVLFEAGGVISGSELNIGVTDIAMDLSLLSRLIQFKYFSLYEGIVTGSASITGRTTDPEFGGALHIENMSIGMPAYMKYPIVSPSVSITARENVLTLASDSFSSNGTPVDVTVEASFDRWSFENLTVRVRMAENTYTPGLLNEKFLNVTGDIHANLDVVIEKDGMSLTGDISVIHPECVIINNFASSQKSDFGFACDLTIMIDSKAQAYYPSRANPIVRGLVTADGPIHVVVDSLSGLYSVTGTLIMRGGEVLYLNRNFYLREGAIYLNESEAGFNPLLNLRAETRERTGDGKLVRIILSVPNQRVKSINPVLSSDSNLSEMEIRTLLGEAVLVESGTSPGAALGQLAASGVDYLIQSTIIRGIENRLRDSLHFDIFSIRSPFVQKAVESAIAESEGKTESLTIGNYFDNTTVYIGKYIGDSVYMDAMFSLRYNENRRSGGMSEYVIQPEIGLEFPAPFANIRWSIAPDLTQSVQNLWVPYTSLSLSWKLSL